MTTKNSSRTSPAVNFDSRSVERRFRPTKFNFTFAMQGGAWLEFGDVEIGQSGVPYRNWYSADVIDDLYGKGFFQRNVSKQGWMTGCWVTCA